MLARAGLGNDALLAHPSGQQSLAQRVVDLVRAGVQQVFALEIDLCPAQLFRQPLAKVERRGPARVILQQPRQLRLKRRVCLGQIVLALQLNQRRHQRLRHIPPAINAKAPRARLGRNCRKSNRCHEGPPAREQKKLGTFQCTKRALRWQVCDNQRRAGQI